MAHLVPKITSLASGFLSDPDKLKPIIGKAFNHFDKDSSGFIETEEVQDAVQHLLTMAHLPQVPSGFIASVWTKVAGPDGRVDLQEFTNLVRQVLAKIKGEPLPVAEHAEAAGYSAETPAEV